jgi:hypothetical protein
VVDRGKYIEVMVGRAVLRAPDFVDVLVNALARFGAKPLLFICDGPADSVGTVEAYTNGLELASRVRSRVAIVLGGREPTEVDRLIHLVARNRGAEVRLFATPPAAKTWLTVD